MSSRGSLRETLVQPKDKLAKAQTVGHVYHIPCAGANSVPCEGRYVGETERTVGARFQEHLSTSSNALGHYKSAMLQHARENGHHFRKDDVTVLCSESDWVKRGIKEALFIKALKPTINIDPGRHSLSSHFDAILSKAVAPPPPPSTHNQEEPLLNTAPRRQGRPRKITPTNTNQTAAQTTAPNQQQSSASQTAAKTAIQSHQPQSQRQSQRLIERQRLAN